MHSVNLEDSGVQFAGILDVEHTNDGAVLRRLPSWTKQQIVDPGLMLIVTVPSGGRLAFTTDATEIELEAALTLLQLDDNPVWPAAFDLVVDDALVDGHATIDGTVIQVDQRTGAIDIRPGAPTTLRFEGLSAGEKHVEIWLPNAASVTLRALRVNDGASVEAPAARRRPRWVHHGSSISHCVEADRPTGTWPAVAARLAGVDLQNLALAGQCQLDQFVARTIRDLPVDFVSLKLGINIVNADAMRERNFVPAVHGFLDTIRDGHPDAPIAVITPILCPAHEDHPGPTRGGDKRITTIPRPTELALGALTLGRIRQLLAEIVAVRIAGGDQHLYLIDGLELFGEADLDDLPDGLHPNSAGYARMGERFHALVFGPDGPFAMR